MNGATRNNSTGRVLSFEQKGDFFYKRGNDKLDKNDLIEALCSYRRAMEQEPEDQFSCIAVGSIERDGALRRFKQGAAAAAFARGC
ncbi:MAG: hypothetical protein V8Q85_00305 [Christensenellales bacterium]